MTQLSDFDYDLPPDLIAKYPLAKRSASRLLILNKKTGAISHGYFADVLDWLSPEDLLVCNNSRVIPARLFGHKESGGRVEVLVERILDRHQILAHLRVSKKPKNLSLLVFENDIRFRVIQRQDDLFILNCEDPRPVLDVIESIGHIPLPAYFKRLPTESDKERYQTIYAIEKGSVAAPTAGLHFDSSLFSKIKSKGISIAYSTLHVGAGTFAPVRVNDIASHRMHAEYMTVSPELCDDVIKTKNRGGRVIAVGTTSVRSLETASLSGKIQPFKNDTRIFIYPGFEFKCIDALITNFHLPRSTLLMLVSAFGGFSNVMRAYQIAIQEKYRFYSYGDAMLLI